jgi:hypothetical protein
MHSADSPCPWVLTVYPATYPWTATRDQTVHRGPEYVSVRALRVEPLRPHRIAGWMGPVHVISVLFNICRMYAVQATVLTDGVLCHVREQDSPWVGRSSVIRRQDRVMVGVQGGRGPAPHYSQTSDVHLKILFSFSKKVVDHLLHYHGLCC